MTTNIVNADRAVVTATPSEEEPDQACLTGIGTVLLLAFAAFIVVIVAGSGIAALTMSLAAFIE
jgi:hypothetical protein